MKDNQYRDLILNCLLLFLGLCFFFYVSLGSRLWNLNDVQFDQSGDGLKNYYTFAYQYRYQSDLKFDGFLYPYGDLTIYADSQIAVVGFLQSLRTFGIDLTDYLLFILNLLPLLSFFIGGVFIILILREYGLNQKYIGITALFCMALSPQVWRIQSHYALSYAFMIPLAWYLFIRLSKLTLIRSRVLISVFAIGLFLILGFVHAYHLITIALFLSAFSLFYTRKDLKQACNGLIVAIIPILIFLAITSFLDSASDRPKNPYGIHDYKTIFRDLFPFYGSFGELVDTILEPQNEYTEGYCYPSFLPFLLGLVYVGRQFFGNKIGRSNIISDLPITLTRAFYAGVLVLLFSMGLHLKIADEFILEVLPKLKQFRGLGRFSWPFYYIGFVFFSFIYWKIVNSAQNRYIRSFLIFLVVGVWVLEASSYHKAFRQNIDNYSSGNLLRDEKSISNMLLPISLIPCHVFRSKPCHFPWS